MRAIVLIAALAHTARADPDDTKRAAHAGAIVATGVLYLALDHTLDPPASCRWCDTNSFDRGVRELRWGNTGAASTASSITAYALTPLATAGLLALSGDGTWRRGFDDLAPVAEATIATTLVSFGTKLSVARRRPDGSDNESFFSAHTSRAFSIAISSGVIASRRHYKLAPAIWAGGIVLASATAYLRVAADKHWATDVIVGGVTGSLVGLAWPTLVPTPSGIAAIGSF